MLKTICQPVLGFKPTTSLTQCKGEGRKVVFTRHPLYGSTDYEKDIGASNSRYIPISRPLTEPRVPVHPQESPPICQANMLPPRSPAKITLIKAFVKREL